jgi:uncharacterized protein (TIGR02271 family)
MRNDNLSSSNTLANDRLVAFFSNREDAFRAIAELKSAGFTENEIGLGMRDDNSYGSSDVMESSRNAQGEGHDKGVWQGIKDFFTGNDTNDIRDTDENHYSMSDMGWDKDRSNYYDRGISAGGAVVTIQGARMVEARPILERHNADLRESGFNNQQYAGTERNAKLTERDRVNADQNYRLQLRGELLRTHKERVQRGEVRLRKEVVTENQTINVPVTREELVIERNRPASETAASGEIGTDQEIRVPLSEERVNVEKRPVVNEEVRVGKRQVQDNRQVTSDVRHEELRVERDGDVQAEGENASSTPSRKKPAA